MITQIDQENTQFRSQAEISEDATALTDTLDDLFDHYASEINMDLRLEERESDEEDDVPVDPNLNMGGAHQAVDIIDESDRTLEVQYSIPFGMKDQEANRLQLVSKREKDVMKNLHLPGKERHLMPKVPTKSERTRNSENPAFYPFCTLPHEDAERMLMLKQF